MTAKEGKNLSTQQLFEAILDDINKVGFDDSEIWWTYSSVLQERADQEVYDTAMKLTHSETPYDRCLGLFILSSLGERPRPYFQPTMERYIALAATEKNDDVIGSILAGLSQLSHNKDKYPEDCFHDDEHTFSSELIRHLHRFKNHKDPLIRIELADRMMGSRKQEAIDLLIELLKDPDDEVRTSAIYTAAAPFGPMEARMLDALASMADDKVPCIRAEALQALATYKHKDAKRLTLSALKELNINLLKNEENNDDYIPMGALQELNDISLLPFIEPLLTKLKKTDGVNEIYICNLEQTIRWIKEDNGLIATQYEEPQDRWTQGLENRIKQLEKSDSEISESYTSLISGMIRFIGYEDTKDLYSPSDVEKCVHIVDNFLDAMKSSSDKEQGMEIVKNTITELNDLNDACDGSLIETDQREELCTILNTTCINKDYSTHEEDITEDYREW